MRRARIGSSRLPIAAKARRRPPNAAQRKRPLPVHPNFSPFRLLAVGRNQPGAIFGQRVVSRAKQAQQPGEGGIGRRAFEATGQRCGRCFSALLWPRGLCPFCAPLNDKKRASASTRYERPLAHVGGCRPRVASLVEESGASLSGSVMQGRSSGASGDAPSLLRRTPGLVCLHPRVFCHLEKWA